MSEQSAKQIASPEGGESAAPGTKVSGAGTVTRASLEPEAGGEADPALIRPTAEEPSLVGTVLLDRYRLLSELGVGGMGTVYLAEHITIRKKLAVKVLSSQFAHKPDLVERFLQEARAASMIDQQNVVEINDFGHTPDGSVFFVMEFLAGEDLSKTIERVGPMPWPRARHIFLQICRALAKAHEVGIIHRDMKPENCFRIQRGKNPDFIKVLDFGIAKVTSGEGEATRGLTRTGMIFGTPEYMSPEQAQGGVLDHRVDVYACGVILYELLTGEVPFTGDNFMAVLTQHMFEAPRAPSEVAPEAGITPQVEAIILKALQKQADLRFASMVDMEEAILAIDKGADPVEVVSESTSVPSMGPMSFSAQQSTIQDIPTAGVAQSGSSKTSRFLLFALLTMGFAAAASVAGYIFLNPEILSDKLPGADQPSPVASAEHSPFPKAPAAADAGQGSAGNPSGGAFVAGSGADTLGAGGPESTKAPAPEPEAPPATVDVYIETPGVQAQVISVPDGQVLGMTGTEQGLQMLRSEEPLVVLLKAEGYQARQVELDLRNNSRLVYELSKLRSKKKRRSKASKRQTRPRKRGKASSASGSSPAKASPKLSGNKELRNPFD